MGLFTRCTALLFLVFGSLMIALPIHAQINVRQWMPSSGNKYVFIDHTQTTIYSHGIAHDGGSSGQYFTYVILKDTNYDLAHPNVVMATLNGDTIYYSFELSSDTNAPLPLVIEQGPTFSLLYDFSTATVSYDTNHLNPIYTLPDGIDWYSSRLHWFGRTGSGTYGEDTGIEYNGTVTE